MQRDLYPYIFRVNLEQDNDLSRENRGIEKEYERYSTSASLIRWENHSRTLCSSRVHHTLSVTHGQFSRMYSNTVYYLRPRLYIYICTHESERTPRRGEQGLTAGGLGTRFARAQLRLGKHPQHSLNARIVCVYCGRGRGKCIGRGTYTPYCNSPRINAEIASRRRKIRNGSCYFFDNFSYLCRKLPILRSRVAL